MVLGEYILFYNGVKHHCSKDQRAKEEVTLMIPKKYINYIMKCQYISERIVMVKLRINNKKTCSGNLRPVHCKPEKDGEQFYEELRKMIDDIPINETVIMGVENN